MATSKVAFASWESNVWAKGGSGDQAKSQCSESSGGGLEPVQIAPGSKRHLQCYSSWGWLSSESPKILCLPGDPLLAVMKGEETLATTPPGLLPCTSEAGQTLTKAMISLDPAWPLGSGSDLLPPPPLGEGWKAPRVGQTPRETSSPLSKAGVDEPPWPSLGSSAHVSLQRCGQIKHTCVLYFTKT